MLKVKIIPAILSYTKDDFLEKLGRVSQFVDRVQIDIVGRAFASQVTVGVEALEEISTGVALDVQLMVKEPISYLNRCDLGGVDRVFGQVEQMRSQEKFVEYAFALGMQAGLALDIATPVSLIEKNLNELDAVLLMSAPAGKSGQKFDDGVLVKIRQIRELHPTISICVDGGINAGTIATCVEAGANEFAVGSFLWESKDIAASIQELMEATR